MTIFKRNKVECHYVFPQLLLRSMESASWPVPIPHRLWPQVSILSNTPRPNVDLPTTDGHEGITDTAEPTTNFFSPSFLTRVY